MYSKTSLLLTIFVTLSRVRIDAVPVEKFYPFGSEHGDTALSKNARETSSPEIQLRVPVKFYSDLYNSLYVSENIRSNYNFTCEEPGNSNILLK